MVFFKSCLVAIRLISSEICDITTMPYILKVISESKKYLYQLLFVLNWMEFGLLLIISIVNKI